MSENTTTDPTSPIVTSASTPEEDEAWARQHDAEFHDSLVAALRHFPDDRPRRSGFLAGWQDAIDGHYAAHLTDYELITEAARRGMTVVDAEQARIERDGVA